MMGQQSKILKDVLLHPRLAFQEIGEKGRYFFPFAVLILVGTTIFFSVTELYSAFEGSISDEVREGFWIEFFAQKLFIPFTMGIVFALASYFIGKKFGGLGSIKGVFSSICYSSFPFVIIGVIFIIPFILYLVLFPNLGVLDITFIFILFEAVTFLFTIWAFILLLFALKYSLKFSWGRSIVTAILSGLVSLIPFFIIGLILTPDYLQRLFWYIN